MTTPRRHHIIPRFFLERFCRDGLLWVYDRDRDAFRRQAPLNTAVMKDYYTFTEADGVKSTEVEKVLAILEGEAKPAIEKLDRREALADPERGALAMFLAFLLTRVPNFERGVNELVEAVVKGMTRTAFGDVERARASLAAYERDTGAPLGSTAEELAAFINNEEAYTIETHRNASLAFMVSAARDVAHVLVDLDWAVIHAPPKKSFVATDNPFIILPSRAHASNFYGVGILTPGASKFIPLGTQLGLMLGEPGEMVRHVDVPERLVRGLNLEIAVRAEGYVFARDERLLRSVVATTGLATRRRSPKVWVG